MDHRSIGCDTRACTGVAVSAPTCTSFLLPPPLPIQNEGVLTLPFPVERYPEKVKSLNLVKAESYTGVLKGIKGQYLIFEDDTVFNVRSNEGLVVSIDTQ